MDDRNLDLDLNLVIDGVKWSPGERVFPLTLAFPSIPFSLLGQYQSIMWPSPIVTGHLVLYLRSYSSVHIYRNCPSFLPTVWVFLLWKCLSNLHLRRFFTFDQTCNPLWATS